MSKARIIIADTDEKYIIPLQIKFIADYFDKVDLEIITDENYFEELFSTPQKVDILVVSENLYNINLQRHNISHTFILTEQSDKGQMVDLAIIYLFKYTSINDIYNKIIGNSSGVLKVRSEMQKDCQIILVYSACGGVGKTTLSLGMSHYLAKSFKRVLYINAARLQYFQRMLQNQSIVIAPDIYLKLSTADDHIYSEIKHIIRKEVFNYLPSFKAPLMSLDLPYSIFETIARSAKASKEYDYIIIDADATFDEDKAKLLSMADKVVIVTKQNATSIYGTNVLVSNINGVDSEKYIFICNDFKEVEENSFLVHEDVMNFKINEYVRHFEHYDQMSCEDLSKASDVQRVTLLVM